MCTYEKNMAGLWKMTKDAVELLSEQVVTENNAVDLAKVASIQAMAIFNDNQGWVRHVINKTGDIIETKPVGGVFKSAGTSISRGFIDIDMDADKLFKFFISPEGYGLIDPDSRPEEQAKYLQRFEGFKQNIPGAKLEVANSFLQLPINFKGEREDTPHVDITDDHFVMLYYVCDSDGDTIIYNEQEKSDSYTVQKRITPKQGRVVLFDGSYYHTAEQPINNIRCVVNYDLK